jgi:hypothetical protein
VEIELVYRNGETERLGFDLVPDQQADFESGFLGESTPLAQNILDNPVGETVPYLSEDILAVRILSVGVIRSTPSDEAAARRAESIRKAVADSQRTSAMIFASSFSGKWGDYDPGGIEKWEDEASP